jgi:hypothetical protein
MEALYWSVQSAAKWCFSELQGKKQIIEVGQKPSEYILYIKRKSVQSSFKPYKM